MKTRFSIITLAFLMFVAATPPSETSKYVVRLTWDANAETDLAGYRMYQGVESGVYDKTFDISAPTTTFEATDLLAKTTYFWVVTAYNTSGLESLPSNEVSYKTGPWGSPPYGLTVDRVRIVMDVPVK